MTTTSVTNTEQYNYDVIRKFAIMTLVWGVVGMLVGVYIASELAFPVLNFDIPYITFGRLRPVHTGAVIFGFGGSALFATSYYIVQRTCQARLFSSGLASFTFWGWQLVILLAAIGATGVLFWRRSRTAALLLLPYGLWVVFAAWLTWRIALLNN